jgi:beta-lactamase regulating signal transducer with metallopeptidase domain
MHLMEIAARWAWETSVAASVLIIPALLAALFLRKPIFTPIRHMLGLLVIVRLLLPFTLPSPLSVFNLFQSPQNIPGLPVKIAEPPFISTPLPKTVGLSQSEKFPLVPLVWIFGVMIIAARIARQHFKVRRWTRPENQITSGSAVEALHSALTISGCRRQVRLYAAPGLNTPALFGLLRPAILLPAELAPSADRTRLRLVCVHEIAHLKRFDVLINWLMIFAQALHWFNPLVWLAMRRMRADQELLCDNDVMRLLRPEEHRSYGETLLALASPRSFTLSPLIPVSSNFKQLKERIAMIKQFKPATSRFLLFALPPLAALIAMLTFTAATTKKAPPTAREDPNKTLVRLESEKADKAFESLKRHTDLQEARVRELESQMDAMRRELKVSFGDEAELHARTSQAIKQIDADRIHAESEYEQFSRLLKELKAKKPAELRNTIPTAYRDEPLDRLLDNLAKSEQQAAVIRKDYADEHPEVVRINSLLKTLNRQIDERVAGVLSGLETIVAARKAIMDSLNAKKEEVIHEDIQGLFARPYFRAKRELESHQRILDSLRMRLAEETVNHN